MYYALYDGAESVSGGLGEPFPVRFTPVRCKRGRALPFETVALGAEEILQPFRSALPIVSDTGDCLFASVDIRGSDFIAPAYYATMGFAIPAALGAQIASGKAHGVLAFDAGEIVGWCNAGPRAAFGNLRVFGSAVDDPREPVGSVMCFVIAPERRREGIATALLGRAEQLFRELGLRVAEAYPRAAPSSNPAIPSSASYYKGSPAMYERAGYAPHRRFERFTCVRKPL
jgi:GNAT superfamily N-acetyltransferase